MHYRLFKLLQIYCSMYGLCKLLMPRMHNSIHVFVFRVKVMSPAISHHNFIWVRYVFG